jgi:hypothetical protein
VAVRDSNNDSQLDIVVANSDIDSVTHDVLLVPTYTVDAASQLTSMAVGNLENDAHMGVAMADNGTSNVISYSSSVRPTALSRNMCSSSQAAILNCVSVTVADLNGDQRLDIVVKNSGSNQIGGLLANGSSTFVEQMVYSMDLRSQSYAMVMGDFDADTQLDIAVANYGSSSISVFFGSADSSFTDQMVFDTGFGSQPFALAAGDMNNDNMTDSVAANNGYGSIEIVMKTC